MGGTVIGGRKAATTNKRKYGEDWFAKIGAIGGKNGHTGGFYQNRELARRAGKKGGRISKRTEWTPEEHATRKRKREERV